MEEAPVFREDGAMRILFGLTVMDLGIMSLIFVLLIKLLPLDGVGAIALSVGLAWFIGQMIAKARAHVPIKAVAQYMQWLGQPDIFEPGPDDDARPLVYAFATKER